jgi:DNA-binding response OmpR family regulator
MWVMPRDAVHRLRRILFVGPVAPFGGDFLSQLMDRDLLDFVVAGNAVAAIDVLARRVRLFDAIMINSVLPDCDGATLCARLRRLDIHIPVLMLGADDSEFDVVRGLDAGANDYVCAPFRLGELRARLRAQIRAYETSDEAVLPIGPFEFRPGSRVLVRRSNGARVRLTDKEAAVLKFLYRAGAPVSRSTLLHEIWGYNARATTHTVETHIYRLRRKVEPEAGQITLLINEDGGYMLVRDLDRPDVPAPLHATATPGLHPSPGGGEQHRQRVRQQAAMRSAS